MQRPMGVTILAVLAAIGGVLGLCGSLALVGLGSLLGGVLASVVGPGVGLAAGGLAVLGGGLLLLVSVLNLAFAYGAWNLQSWAWMLGVVAQVLALVSAVLSIFGGDSVGNHLVSVAIAGIILYYLNTPDVKRAFGRV